MIKSLLATVAVTLGCTVPALAENTLDDHRHLLRAIQSVGVETIVNDPTECGQGLDGVYISIGSQLVICQDNAKFHNEEVEWTENDLDTLRHEAHHLIQDCADRQRGDGNLVSLFDDENYHFVVHNSLGSETVKRIIMNYKEIGADSDTIVLELEAFAVANAVPARSIGDKVIQLCTP